MVNNHYPIGNKILFAGHFDIGEVFSDESKILIKEARKNHVDYAVLIGDIGMEYKFIDFLTGGFEKLVEYYLTRYECSGSNCIRTQLTSSKAEINNIICKKTYHDLENAFKSEHPVLLKLIKHSGTIEKEVIEKIKAFLKTQMDTVIIPNRLREYDLKGKVLVFKERNLRNKVSQRLKKSRQKNWNYFMHPKLVLNENNNPVCRGILFAFFEKINELGYQKIDFSIEQKHFKAISTAWFFFESYQSKIHYLNTTLSAGKFITPINLKQYQ